MFRLATYVERQRFNISCLFGGLQVNLFSSWLASSQRLHYQSSYKCFTFSKLLQLSHKHRTTPSTMSIQNMFYWRIFNLFQDIGFWVDWPLHFRNKLLNSQVFSFTYLFSNLFLSLWSLLEAISILCPPKSSKKSKVKFGAIFWSMRS
jgi:hypothetical protein